MVSDERQRRSAHRHELADAQKTVFVQWGGTVYFKRGPVLRVVTRLRGPLGDFRVLDAVQRTVQRRRHEPADDEGRQEQRCDRSTDTV